MDDYISRQDFVEMVQIWQRELPLHSQLLVEQTLHVANALPPADVRPVVRGKWEDMGDFIKCSVCKATRLKEFNSYYGKVQRLVVETNFCPNCGAQMGGDAE